MRGLVRTVLTTNFDRCLPERAALAGLGAAAFERLSPHGLRAGFVTKAYRNGSGPRETHA